MGGLAGVQRLQVAVQRLNFRTHIRDLRANVRHFHANVGQARLGSQLTDVRIGQRIHNGCRLRLRHAAIDQASLECKGANQGHLSVPSSTSVT